MGMLEDIKDGLIGTEKQNKEGQQNLDKAATSGSKLAIILGGKPAPTEPVKKAKGGKISSASTRADGIAQRGKTRGTYC
jgi:hypothetical protein